MNQEINDGLTLTGYVARDACREVYLYINGVPERDFGGDTWGWGRDTMDILQLPDEAFPDLDWEDEPRKVKLIVLKEE